MKMRTTVALAGVLAASSLATSVSRGKETVEKTTCSESECSAQMDSNGCPINHPDCADCSDRRKDCRFYQRHGSCDSHPGWMLLNCARTCRFCHYQDFHVRCQHFIDIRGPSRALESGGHLNSLFHGIVNKSVPPLENSTHEHWMPFDLGIDDYNVSVASRDPWVLQFDGLLSEEEARAVISAAPSFERSTDVGRRDSTGHFAKITSKSRTSSNAWCQPPCSEDPTVRRLINRLTWLIGIPYANSEHLQILQYEIGQYYTTHNDFIETQMVYPCGDVEEGGHTGFPRIIDERTGKPVSVKPKVGRAVLWPSVLDSDVTKADLRTAHTADPVAKGTKYGVNAWFHLFDFQTPNLWSCTG